MGRVSDHTTQCISLGLTPNISWVSTMYWEPCLAVMYLIRKEGKKGGLGIKSLSQTTGRSEKALVKPMRNPGAVILNEVVPFLNSGPKLEPLLISINALSMVGEGGRNMTYRSNRWRLHSLLGLPEAHSPCFPTPTQQQTSLSSGSPLEICHAPAELFPFLSQPRVWFVCRSSGALWPFGL